jgi:hypothetical protein
LKGKWELAQKGSREEQDKVPDKEAELTEVAEPNELSLNRDEEQLNKEMDALKTEEKADTMELGRDLEGILELLKENEKDDLMEREAWQDCSKPGAPPGPVHPPPNCPQT